MRYLVFLFSQLWFGISLAGELPWIGVSLNPASSESIEATGLSHGVGFEVSKVIPGGPLSRAGGERGDLWWKFDGQILVNKSQMVVLLREKSPGDIVSVDYYREGKLERLDLKLGSRNRPVTYPVSIKHKEPDASRILAKRERVARVTLDDRELSLRKEGEKWRFKVLKGRTEILSVLVSDEGLAGEIPSKWHESFLILRQTLGHSGQVPPGQSPKRVRYVPKEKTSVK